MNLSGPTG